LLLTYLLTYFSIKHKYLIQLPTTNGTFFFRVLRRLRYGLKHTLTLIRKSDDDAIFRANAADAGKVTIDKIETKKAETVKHNNVDPSKYAY